MDLIIYGAQGLALGAYRAIKNLYSKRSIRCFLVTKREGNAKFLDNIPVVELETFSEILTQKEKDNVEILIATPESVMSEIEENLDKSGLYCHVRLNSMRWAKLMELYYACDRQFVPLSVLPIGYHKADLQVLMAKFYKDRQLSGKCNIPEWVTPIQVGATLCEKRVAELLDNSGDNISAKNVNYSELTGLYWLWKNKLLTENINDRNEYYGLVHYRRVLSLSDDDLLRLVDNDVDVILPYPMPYEPNIEIHHEKYLKDADWQVLLSAIRELEPNYATRLPKVMDQQYLYNYNIIIARKQVLIDYCQWLFPILERIEETSIPRGIERKDRYIGYMGETLETIYFMLNLDNLNITHAGCDFMI